MRRRAFGAAMLALLLAPQPAAAQLDPLLFLKRTQPNVLIAVDTANRMQRDTSDNYRDDNVYRRQGTTWETALGVTNGNTTQFYRRKYVGLAHVDTSLGTDKFEVDHIEVVGDRDPGFASFDEGTRLAIARRSLTEAIARNAGVVRFGLLRTRQDTPRYVTPASAHATRWNVNEGPVRVNSSDLTWAAQKTDGDNGSGKWAITRPVVARANALVGATAALVGADAPTANSSVLGVLGLAPGAAGSLTAAGMDAKNYVDAPLDNMLDDLKTEAARLIAADAGCRNTVAILVVGGGEGSSTNEDPAAKAKQFLNVSAGRRVPIYVIALAPQTAAERTQLQAVATNSGGVYTEITAAMVAAAPAGQPVPEFVRAVNVAISHAFVAQVDFDRAPDVHHPYGYDTEHQTTSPIVGTVNLQNARDITGVALPNSSIANPTTSAAIPQRSNVMVTTGFSLPRFDGKLRAFRVYKPTADTSKASGYAFHADGTRLWVAGVPSAAARNIYTSLPDGTIVAFTAANAATLQPYLRTATAQAASALIDFVRSQPLGAIVGSTPAIMDVPTLDPPPDSDYPAFAYANRERRSIVWVGANDGMLHAIDGRLGQEVWAFIPYNLLPKLATLQSGQPSGDFRFFVDGSPKIADVKVGGKWRTYLVMGEGAGGTFYQTFDVTLDDISKTAAQTSDNIADVLTYFSSAASVPLKWSFPDYRHFDTSIGAWGDIAQTAPAVEKSVGETWSDPAVGQVQGPTGRFVVLTGSGFFKWSLQQQANRGGAVAGSTFYVLDAENGAVLDSRDVGNDKKAETVDNCAAVNDCSKLKNALQADPVATGPADSRFITKVYLGDLDGKIWRFDLGLDAVGVPRIKQLLNLYTVSTGAGLAESHPIFSSMATVNVGGASQYLFVGTGSDMLPSHGVNVPYALLVVLDQGTTGSKTAQILLERTDRIGIDEKITAFPAVAGDIVFFATSNFGQGGCVLPAANLYAFTFIGGAAYDTNGDGRVTPSGKSGADSTRIRTSVGGRASAPFIVDQHLVFAAGDKIEMFGDPKDFNNGVGQAGVRILSWREAR